MNLFGPLPDASAGEVTDILVQSSAVRVERIVSAGQASEWYDQDQTEWVCLLRGGAVLEWEGGAQQQLGPGDCLVIPAHARHRVAWTSPVEATIWLCVFCA